MAKRDRTARKASTSPREECGPITLVNVEMGMGTGTGTGRPKPERLDSSGDVFASDVNVRGWKIVGGKGFTDKAKVGAYVGEYAMSAMYWRTFGTRC